MAGIGSRLRPHTLTVPKPLTLIAGKPIVQRLVEDIAKVVNQKIDEIAFIIGPVAKGFPADTESQLLKIADNLGASGKVFIQEEALGTAHAIYQSASILEGNCVIAFADTLFKADFKLNEQADGVIWVKQVENPKAFGVIKISDGRITDFVEKPQEFVSDLAIIGIYYFKNGEVLKQEIQHLLDNDIKEKGEYQLTNALENMKQKGLLFVPGQVDEWMDCGNKDVTVLTNKKVLEFNHLDGENMVAADVELENSEIIQPCYIGNGVTLRNTKIGPYVSLGDGCTVENSMIENSLIQQKTQIKYARLTNAMIGSNAIFNGKFTSVSIGDYSELS